MIICYTCRSPSQDDGILAGILVGVGIGRCQTNRLNSIGNNHRRVHCYDGHIIGLITKLKLRNDNLLFFGSTYVGKRIEFAVKDNFSRSPRHLDVCLTRHANQYGHTLHFKCRHSLYMQEKEKRFTEMKR